MCNLSCSLIKWLMLAAVIVLADYFTKQWALLHLVLHEPQAVLPYFNFTLVYNQGAAFSMLSNENGWQRWFLSAIALVVSVFIVYWLKRTPQTPTVHKLGLACVLGGALGNAIDRLYYGYVIDFLDFHLGVWHFPAFNLADSAITCGAILLLLTMWKKT